MPFLALLVLLFFPSPTFSQGRHPSPSPTPAVSLAADHFWFRSFEDEQGGFFVVWPQPENDRISLKIQHVDADGNDLWEHGKYLTASLTPDASWDAGPDSKGGVLLAWEKEDHVFARRFNAEGQPVWPAKDERLSVASNTQSSPIVAADGSGGSYVIWQEKPAPTRWVLMAQHVNAMGAPLWTSRGTRVSLRPSNQIRPRVVYDGAAGVILVWQDFRENASQIQAQRLNFQGNRLWGLEGVLITAPAGDPNLAPYLGAVGGGSAVFAWKASSSATERIFIQRVNASGKPSWDPHGVELTKGNWNEWNPVLHGDGQGGSWVAWEDFRNNANWVAYVKHFDLKGQAVGSAETLLSTVQADQGHIALTDDGAGGVLAAWVDNRYGTVGVYAQEIDAKGQVLLGTEGLKVGDQLKNPQTPQIVPLGHAGLGVSWADNTSKGTWSLYWRRIDLKR